MLIKKINSISLVAKTVLSDSAIIERNLVVPYGVINKILLTGYADLYEFKNTSNFTSNNSPSSISANINGYDKMIDFDDSTYNYTASAQVSASEDIIEWDLGAIKDVIIYVKTGVWKYNANSVDLMVSNDGTTWTTLWQNVSPANGVNAYQWASKVVKTTCRYVKLYYNDISATSNNYAVATFEIYVIGDEVQKVSVDSVDGSADVDVITHNEEVQIICIVNGTTEYAILELNPSDTVVTEVYVE